MSTFEAQVFAVSSYGRHLRKEAASPRKHEPKISESAKFWQNQVRSIKEFDDFDVEFGKRFLLELLSKPDGEEKFMSFMSRSNRCIKHFSELEALDLTDEEEKLFDDMPISKTVDKFLRTKGWSVYGSAMAVGGIIGITDAIFYYSAIHPPAEIHSFWLNFISSPYHYAIYPAFELLLGALLANTTSHEIDDLKYEELQRAVLTLTEKFPDAFIEESVRNVRSTHRHRPNDVWHAR